MSDELTAQTIMERKPVNWRSILLGLTGAAFINGLAPFNNFVLNNTNLISNAMPIGLLLFFMVFVLLINAPLWKFVPRLAFGRAELTVALAMTLVSCTLPGVGLMRALPGNLVGVYYWAAEDPNYAKVVDQAKVPDWVLPQLPDGSAKERGNDPVVKYFYSRVPVDQDTFANRFMAVPWKAWVRPVLTWGIFFGLLYGMVICLSTLMRRQWVENERLPFPIAGIYMSIIEPPKPGKAFNTLFSHRGFWVTAGIVFLIHSLSALHAYDTHWPEVPLTYDLRSIFSEPPLSYTDLLYFQQRQIYIVMIGITYFVQSRVAFSLFFFYLLMQIVRMGYGVVGDTYTGQMADDMIMGGMLPFLFTIIYTARGHLSMVIRHMFARKRPDDPVPTYLAYAFNGWALIFCMAGLVAWLMMAGTSLVAALVIVLMMLAIYVSVSRIVAETGLLYVLLPAPFSQPWAILANSFPDSEGIRTTVTSYWWSRFFYGVLCHDTRESLPAYAMHSLRVADQTAYDKKPYRQSPLYFIGCMILALVVAWFIAWAATLYIHYSYPATLDKMPTTPIANWGSQLMPKYIILDDTRKYAGGASLDPGHNHYLHLGVGFGVTTLLSVLTLMSANWPFHPLGFLMCETWGIQETWFSIMIGWIAKEVIVRLGGATLYTKLRPIFIGLIIGEIAAVAFWLVVVVILNWLGMDYNTVQMLPV